MIFKPKKMTLIKLFNRIAKDKKVPKKIKYLGITFKLSDEYWYESYRPNGEFFSVLESSLDLFESLHDEIEILEW